MGEEKFIVYGDGEKKKNLLLGTEDKGETIEEFQIVQVKSKKRQCPDKDIVLSVTSLILSLIALWANFLR